MSQSSTKTPSPPLGAGNEENGPNGKETVNQPLEKTIKPRRAACLRCRHRKVRCSGGVPSCARCIRLGHGCVYKGSSSEGRPQLPGHIQDMKARLGQLEMLVNHQLSGNLSPDIPTTTIDGIDAGSRQTQDLHAFPGLTFDMDFHQPTAMNVDSMYGALEELSTNVSISPWAYDSNTSSNFANLSYLTPTSGISMSSNPVSTQSPGINDGPSQTAPRAAESSTPLPLSALLQNIWNDFQNKYFELVHPSILIPEQDRFFANASNALQITNTEFKALRLAVQMHGSLAIDPASRLHNEYYHDARQNLERLETSGSKIGLATIQAWALISIYEFKQLLFAKAWMSSGRASRFAQMIGLHRLGSHRNNMVDMNSPLLDQPEQYQESCRTLACVFILDRFTSMGTGLPMILEKKKITTIFPCPNSGQIYDFLADDSTDITPFSPLAKFVFISDICARAAEHANSPVQQEASSFITSHDYWLDHHHFEQQLSALAKSCSLDEAESKRELILRFVAIAIQCGLIYLYKGAIDHSKKIDSMQALVKEYMDKCLQAALKVASIIKSLDITKNNPIHPFLSWSIYCATKVTSFFLTRDPSMSALLETQNMLFGVLTKIGGRSGKADMGQSAPFPGVTQITC